MHDHQAACRQVSSEFRWFVATLPAGCAALCGDVLSAWRNSPMDRFAWVACAIWLGGGWVARFHSALLSPVFQASASKAAVARSLGLALAATALALLGVLGDLNVARHAALLLAVAAALAPRWTVTIWVACGVCWLPAWGWLIAREIAPTAVLPARLAVAVAGAALLALRPAAATPKRRQPSRRTLTQTRWSLPSSGELALRHPLGHPLPAERPAVPGRAHRSRPLARRLTAIFCIAALSAAAIWIAMPLDGAEDRLLALPVSGPGFRSRALSLSAGERRALGNAIACRRLYHFDGLAKTPESSHSPVAVIASIIDATHHRHAIHDPLYCVAGSGWRVRARSWLDTTGGRIRVVCLERRGLKAELAYWFTDGRRRHASATWHRAQATLRRLTCGWLGAESLLVVVQPLRIDVEWRRALGPGSPLLEI